MTNKIQTNISDIPRFEYELSQKYIDQNKHTDPCLQKLLRTDLTEAGYCYSDQQLDDAATRVEKNIRDEVSVIRAVDASQIETIWADFNLLFFLILAIRLIGVLLSYKTASSDKFIWSWVTLGILIMTTIWMPYILWSYQRKITGRPDRRFYWILGFFWAYWFGPLAGYFMLWKANKQEGISSTDTKNDSP